jgi:hypothetical protein
MKKRPVRRGSNQSVRKPKERTPVARTMKKRPVRRGKSQSVRKPKERSPPMISRL